MTTLFYRHFTTPDVHPFDTVKWESRTASITNDEGKVVFQQDDVEFPTSWSQLATNIVASKYFRGILGTPSREQSLKRLISRVVGAIAQSGFDQGYFDNAEQQHAFEAELAHIILYQYGTFNSPVWFNVGIEPNPQTSACFVVPVQDDLASILKLAHTEAMIFKGGSGTGTNLSPLRSSKEHLSGGGLASGPVSFMRGFDAFTGVIKSGGKTRRAAKMVILNADHPDIVEFVRCKAEEERKAWALIDAGYDGSMDGEAYASVFYQNSNNSVRVTDDFMQRAVDHKDWKLIARTTGEVVDTINAHDLLMEIANAAHQCGDPGLQFDTTINSWHTCKESGRINASNACTEVQFIDNSACNLATVNLLAFLPQIGEFDITGYQHTIDILFIAQDILIGMSSYPTPEIKETANNFRNLGINYSNLGAFLMVMGLPYDSDEGRNMATKLTGLMTGRAYLMSAMMARRLGPFREYTKNESCMRDVINRHLLWLEDLDETDKIENAMFNCWVQAMKLGAEHGFRNAQASLLAPTGTISFMMDCITTGIEPEFALVKVKNLVGGGYVKTVNPLVGRALRHLGYPYNEIDLIEEHIEEHGTVVGSCIRDRHIQVFDCAAGKRPIPPMGHLKMVAAVQPLLSGAISKTINLPNNTTPEEIANLYVEAWKLGIKAMAVYRDGSKRIQPLQTETNPDCTETKPEAEPTSTKPHRRHLPDERTSITHKFSISGHEGYITVGMFEDGTPGELFIRMAKAGSVVAGMMDAFALAISVALQYGVPLTVLSDKYIHSRFEPAGFTGNPQIPIAKSIVDYIFRWLVMKFPNPEEQLSLPVDEPRPDVTSDSQIIDGDAQVCVECGGWMTRSGTCYKCHNCGSSSGCG